MSWLMMSIEVKIFQQIFVFRIFEQSAFVNNYLLCYGPTVTNHSSLSPSSNPYLPVPVVWQSLQKTIRDKLVGQRSGTAWAASWAGRTGEHKHRTFPSRWQSLRAATCSLEESILPLLQCWLSSTVKKVLMLWAATSQLFLIEGSSRSR